MARGAPIQLDPPIAVARPVPPPPTTTPNINAVSLSSIIISLIFKSMRLFSRLPISLT